MSLDILSTYTAHLTALKFAKPKKKSGCFFQSLPQLWNAYS